MYSIFYKPYDATIWSKRVAVFKNNKPCWTVFTIMLIIPPNR
jgi:hypothetical protein